MNSFRIHTDIIKSNKTDNLIKKIFILTVFILIIMFLISCENNNSSSNLSDNFTSTTISSPTNSPVDSHQNENNISDSSTLNYNDLTNSEKIIWEFYNTVNDRETHPDGNWEKRAELTDPLYRDVRYAFSNNPENRENHTGLFNVKSMKIVYMKQIETGSQDKEIYPDNEIITYVVGMDCMVYEDNGFYFNGLNWDYVPLVNWEDSWYVMSGGGGGEQLTLEEAKARWGE